MKESEEWEAAEMSILSIGLERGQEIVQKICEIAKHYAPEYDVWKISEDYRKGLEK